MRRDESRPWPGSYQPNDPLEVSDRMTETDDRAALAPLERLVGAWDVTFRFPWLPDQEVRGRTTFEWALDRRFLLQRADAEAQGAPSGLTVIAPAPAPEGGFLQHYFDSRGVVRLYRMTLDDTTWTLRREVADFSPLSFGQRFVGTFQDGGRVIDARWEKDEGSGYELDFHLRYERAD